MSSSTGPSLPPPGNHAVEVCGRIPAGLSGRMLGVGRDGVVHSIVVGPGRTVSYQTQQLPAELMVRDVVAFGGTILAFSIESPAFDMGAELDTFRVVDLAGQRRVIGSSLTRDPVTGELHLVALTDTAMQAHTVVTTGAFTRRTWPIENAVGRITDLALTADRVVYVADSFAGIAPRDGKARTTWIETGHAAPRLVHARDVRETVTLLVLTPTLERWTLRTHGSPFEREVLDKTPRRYAHTLVDDLAIAPRFVWTTGAESLSRHDLIEARHLHHSPAPHVPGDFVVVPDAARPDDTEGAWLVGLFHEPSSATTDLRVLAAADIAAPAVATVRVPHAISPDVRVSWIFSTQH